MTPTSPRDQPSCVGVGSGTAATATADIVAAAATSA